MMRVLYRVGLCNFVRCPPIWWNEGAGWETRSVEISAVGPDIGFTLVTYEGRMAEDF